MKLPEAIKSLSKRQATSIAQTHATKVGIEWQSGINCIFNACLNDPNLSPTNIGTKKDSATEVVEKWVQKYKDGYTNRISAHRSNMPSTIADPIIEVIIQGRLTHLDQEYLLKIKYAHRLCMSAENILGLLLEEYLAVHLAPQGWFCAWGETIRSVDFCSSNGGLLQIKNRSNSENSSSSRVREGTDISKWYRIDAISGKFLWDDLNAKLGVFCSEGAFRDFVRDALSHNPEALAIEPENPWLTGE